MTASLGAAIAGAIARGVGGSASAARGARAGFALAEFLHEADQSESRGGRIIDLGNGMKYVPNEEAKRKLLHHPAVVAAITAKAEQMARYANNLSITEDAEYGVTVQNNPETTRARARVRPMNYEAMVDDAYHSTLLKTLAAFPSDPKS